MANLNAWPTQPSGWPGHVHSGFFSQFQDQKADLDTTLDTLTSGGVNDILITGHSLGGALSWVATYYIKDKYKDKVGVEVLSFAAPSVGDSNFMDWIYKNVLHRHHVVYNRDAVPCVPPGYQEQKPIMHWLSHRTDHMFGSRQHWCVSCLSVGDHMMPNYCHIVGAGSCSGCPNAFCP